MKLHNYNSFIKESLQNIHSYYLPTYEECREMCDNNDNLIFYESKHVLDGYNISIFNYRLASYNHFHSENIEIEENGETIIINGIKKINDKRICDFSNDELINIGFQKLSEFKI